MKELVKQSEVIEAVGELMLTRVCNFVFTVLGVMFTAQLFTTIKCGGDQKDRMGNSFIFFCSQLLRDSLCKASFQTSDTIYHLNLNLPSMKFSKSELIKTIPNLRLSTGLLAQMNFQ